MKLQRFKPHAATGLGQRQAQWLVGRADGGLCVQQLHQALGRARRAQQVAIDLAQHCKSTSQQDHIDHGLP